MHGHMNVKFTFNVLPYVNNYTLKGVCRKITGGIS